ncbi:hypothetical protein [Pseudomonas jinjuensis]|uniref:hypothetical protein n=1 Tax=Pseudomonas jinjuensis TaxID=198616 RepID=UPI000A020344|nr:hypothetical protein [Pseudomonas jinjuensis]
MSKKRNGEQDGLKALLRYSEDVEEFRARMDDYWRERRVLSRLRPGERLPLRGGPCVVLLKELVPALHRHGYLGELATLSDAVHAVEFYENSRTDDPLGIALSDAVLCAMRLADSPLDPSDAETLLWRLCYRLSYRAWLDLDAKQATDKRKTRKALDGRLANDWDKKAAIAYVENHARMEDGRLKSKAQLSREIYPYLRQHAAETGQRFGLASLGDGVPTERALKTIQGWFSKMYAAM